MQNPLGTKMVGDMTWEDLENMDGLQSLKQFCSMQNKKITVSVEGNIGCGKSTLLKYFQSSPNVECVKEPVDKWTDLKGYNPLHLLYENAERWTFSFNKYALLTRLDMHIHKTQMSYENTHRWAFTFNNYCLLTRMGMHTAPCTKPVRMLERSLYSTMHVFVQKSFENGKLTSLEYAVLDEWYQHIIKTQDIGIDLLVYLKAPPEVCYDRIKMRARKEESCVPYDFIESLHDLHEEWLVKKTRGPLPAPVLILDASLELPKMKEVYDQRKSEILCGCA